jgi:hypothetical protein
MPYATRSDTRMALKTPGRQRRPPARQQPHHPPDLRKWRGRPAQQHAGRRTSADGFPLQANPAFGTVPPLTRRDERATQRPSPHDRLGRRSSVAADDWSAPASPASSDRLESASQMPPNRPERAPRGQGLERSHLGECQRGRQTHSGGVAAKARAPLLARSGFWPHVARSHQDCQKRLSPRAPVAPGSLGDHRERRERRPRARRAP